MKILAAQLLLLAMLVCVAEFAHRLFTDAGRRHTAQETRASLESVRSRTFSDLPLTPGSKAPALTGVDTLRQAHPFTGYNKIWTRRYVDALLRQREGGDWDSSYKVMVLGGSVAKIVCDGAGERIAELLAADPRLNGRPVRMLCLGSGGFKQPQQVTLAAWLFSLDLVPDALINVDGFNEVALSVANASNHGVHPLFPSFSHWGVVAGGSGLSPKCLDLAGELLAARRRLHDLCGAVLTCRLQHSSLAAGLSRKLAKSWQSKIGRLQKRLATELVQMQAERVQGPELLGETSQTLQVRALQVAVTGWAHGTRQLSALCKEYEVHYLHVLQPTLCDPGAKPATPEELETLAIGPANEFGVRNGYPMLREAGAKLSKGGLAFRDVSGLFSAEQRTVYVDSCHFNKLGNLQLGEAIGRAFLASLP